MSQPLPTIFVSHGAPDILLSQHAAIDALRQIAIDLPVPRAIVIASAHWIDDPVGITTGNELATIHDFGGFPAELYGIQYPAHGDDELSNKIAGRVQQQGIEIKQHPHRGLDHGAWIPLSFMYPDADIPVVQLSLTAGSLADLVKLGEALLPFRNDNVLIVGSGGSVHNLRELSYDDKTDDWAIAFETWLLDTVENNHFNRLLDPAQYSSNFKQAHPTIEHYAPLVFAWAAADRGKPGCRVHHSFSYGNLGMSAYVFN